MKRQASFPKKNKKFRFHASGTVFAGACRCANGVPPDQFPADLQPILELDAETFLNDWSPLFTIKHTIPRAVLQSGLTEQHDMSV